MWYGMNILKSHLLPGFDPKDVRQYFPIARAFPAMQHIAQDVFRLRLDPIEDVKACHPTVSACLVYDTSSGQDTLLGRMLFDIYLREGKLDGASTWWVPSAVADRQLAEVILLANSDHRPGSCMSFRELETLLHELGHSVHGLLSRQRYARLSLRVSTELDFLEVPSQMLELWLTDKTLFGFAVNAEGRCIPDKVLDDLLTANKVDRGLSKRRLVVAAKYAVS